MLLAILDVVEAFRHRVDQRFGFLASQNALHQSDDEDADVLFMVSRAIEGAEHQEENLSGWATFRGWLSFRRSTGRERARVDQSAYEQILGDFIAAGELSWK